MKHIKNTISEKWASYHELSQNEKKEYWKDAFLNELYRWNNDKFQIDVAHYRKYEPKFDDFIEDIINLLSTATWENKGNILKSIFILDDIAKKYLNEKSEDVDISKAILDILDSSLDNENRLLKAESIDCLWRKLNELEKQAIINAYNAWERLVNWEIYRNGQYYQSDVLKKIAELEKADFKVSEAEILFKNNICGDWERLFHMWLLVKILSESQ